MDRLLRNATVAALTELGLKVHYLALGGADRDRSVGRITIQVMNTVAEFERDLLIERANAGINTVKVEGKQCGMPSEPTNERTWRRDLSQGDSVAA